MFIMGMQCNPASYDIVAFGCWTLDNTTVGFLSQVFSQGIVCFPEHGIFFLFCFGQGRTCYSTVIFIRFVQVFAPAAPF
jgi:hypothetical protein